MAMNRFMVGQGTASKAGGELSSKVSESLYSQKAGTKVKNAFEATKVSKGNKTVFDVYNYNNTVGNILKNEKVFSNGQSNLAKLVRDTYSAGGSIPKEILDIINAL